MPTPKRKTIGLEATCPECGVVFTDGWKESLLISDPDEPLTLECPDCDCEFEQGYSYDQATGTVSLAAAIEVTEHGDQYDADLDLDGEGADDDEEDDEEDDDEDDE
jgi:hypothetical protein